MEREIELTTPSKVVKVPKVAEKTADRALKELGMVTLSARKIKSSSIVGKFLEQVGIINYGNGRLIATAQALWKGVEACTEITSNREMDNDTRRDFMRLQLDLCKALDENTSKLIAFNDVESHAQKVASAVKPFQIGTPVSAIQINVGEGAVVKEEHKP